MLSVIVPVGTARCLVRSVLFYPRLRACPCLCAVTTGPVVASCRGYGGSLG